MPESRLSETERAALAGSETENLYGVARLEGQGSGSRIVSEATALLLFTLNEPGPLPGFWSSGAGGPERQAELRRLLLDGFLEVRRGSEFRSGLEIPPAEEGVESKGAGGGVRALSRAAVRWAAELELQGEELSSLPSRLYVYNRIPLTPRWARRLADVDSVRRWLDPEGRLESIASEWQLLPRRGEWDWLQWNRRSIRRGSDERSYKLYLSPTPEALPRVFSVFLEALRAMTPSGFKVGGDCRGVLRPDKFVAYFSDFEQLEASARLLHGRLRGEPSQGVPFTAEISGDGLLSWGADPPRRRRAGDGGGGESWRMWVVNRVAAALALAGAGAGAVIPRWRRALERLRLEGIDVETWQPSQRQFDGIPGLRTPAESRGAKEEAA